MKINPQSQKQSLLRALRRVPILSSFIFGRQKIRLNKKYKFQQIRTKFEQIFDSPLKRTGLIVSLLLVFIIGTFSDTFKYVAEQNRRVLSAEIESLIRSQSYDLYESKIEYSSSERAYLFNDGYQSKINTLGINSGPKFSGSFSVKAKDGVTVIDPYSSTSIKLYPLFELRNAMQDGSRIIYPFSGGIDGYKVVTLNADGYKEDLVLEEYFQNNMDFSYRLVLMDHMEARLEANGSVGIYSVDEAFLGDVSTGSEKDEQLLEKLRTQQAKTNLLYEIPAPFVREAGSLNTQVGAYFSLEGDILTTHVRGLAGAKYPLTIDPSVYVDTARKLSRGNNETNIDFDVSNELIQKGATTGGRFPDWQTTLAMDRNYWGSGTAVANGYVYSIGGGLADDSLYLNPGESQFVVPAGVTSVSVKIWGGGGGGGGASEDGNGGSGGGAGYAAATLSVTAGEVLTVRVGEGGKGGGYTAPDDVIVGSGGGGGGYSGVFRSTTPLAIAGGGGGGGGDNGAGTGNDGGNGGPGGGTSGVVGTGDGSTTGGGAGTSGAGGSAGTNSTSGGTAGSSLQGGTGASERNTFGDAAYGGGGAGGKGDTGTLAADRDAGGGGGGGGYYGGGGGGRSNADTEGGAGGGGGSGYITGTSTTLTAGSGVLPGNDSDSDRANEAGRGGAGGVETGGTPTEGTDGYDGLVLITVASSQVDATDDVWWAEIDSTSLEINSPNPGAGACTQWCNESVYDLPAARIGASVVAYNGFLYVVGGENASRTRQTTVYIAKLGANGEPSLWHPTDPDPANWGYWYTDTALSTEKSFASLAAYNNRLYLMGGQTNASTGGVTEVLSTEIEPTGTLAGWSATGMTSLPSARHNHASLVYNDHIYLIGGNSSGTIQSAVHYVNLKTDGTMDGNWVATTSLDTARMAFGGKFAAIFGGFIYIAGGCSATGGGGQCSTIQDDVRLVSINADGSLAKWTTILDVTNERIGHGLEAWGGALYTIGGCRKIASGTDNCEWGVSESVFGTINPDGDASTVRSSVLSGTAPCSGGSPTDCHLPPEGDNNGNAGNMSGSAVINNGIIYYFGGCTSVGNGSICYTGVAGKATDNIFYAAIGDDGALSAVPSGACTGSGNQYYGSWCVVNKSSEVMPVKLAGSGVALFDNTVYIIGGTTGSEFQDDVHYMTFDSDGSIGTWNTQTFSALDLGSARGYMYAFTRANPSSAGTYPGNLFVIGGCAPNPVTGDGVNCSDTQFTEVYKCNITTSGALETADANDCTTSGQLQLDSEPATGGSQGLGTMSGTVYANYVYLIGGESPNESSRGSVMYAKIDDSNNIVDADGETIIDNIWETSPNEIDPVRRRGSAFGYNGYLYALAGYNAGETLNDLLYAKIDVSDGSIEAFSESDVTVLPRWDLQAIVSNGFVFTLGGCSTGVPPQDCTTMTRTVQTFQLYNNYSGSPSGYSASANLYTTDRIGASTAVLDGKIYIAGGCVSTDDCSDTTDNVQFATIDAGGSVGTWANTADSTLPGQRAWGQLEAAGGTLYYIGGQDDTDDEKSDVYYATPAQPGEFSTIAQVQSAQTGTCTGSSSCNATATITAATSGNLIVGVCGGETQSSWSGGGLAMSGYTAAIAEQSSSLGAIRTFYKVSTGGETSVTCTITESGQQVGGKVVAYELSGVDTSSPVDVTASNSGSGSSPTTGTTSSSTQDDTFAIAGIFSHAASSTHSGWTNSFTEDADTSTANPGGNAIGTASLSAITTQTFSTTATLSSCNPVCGGYHANVVVFKSGALATGDVENWATASNGLPADRTQHSAAVWNDRIYVLGGLDDTAAVTNTVYYSPDLSSGGNITSAWTSDTDTFDVARSGTTAVAYANNLYIFGGYDGSNYLNDAQFTQINSDGSIDAWSFTTSLPEPIRQADGFAVNGYLYLIGGRTADTTCASNTWVTPISANTTIASGNNPTGVGQWYETIENYTGNRYGAAVSYYDGNAFISGGGCGTILTYTGANRVVQTALQSQPQVARYSYFIDADTDVFPSNWLVNGLDNDIGARWFMNYRSSTDSNNEWGQETVFGEITLGNVEVYNPLDASGTDTEFARYYYLQLDIDSSQAYGYPDDVTRGPTIDDLTLFFTADPSKALRHGKTFIQGLQQPLHTPPP